MERYDVGIIGAGLAGMSLALQLSRAGKKVLLAEQGTYPRHKVCGEFLSMESLGFLERLGIPLSQMNLPQINKLVLSSEKGAETRANLDVGGIGISRFMLDDLLCDLVKQEDITYLDQSKVEDASVNSMHINGQQYNCDLVVASYGKYPPSYAGGVPKKTRNFVGVKYHIKYDHPSDEIALHSFQGGYCGMSKIEEDVSCLCYLIDSSLIRAEGGIAAVEEAVLWKNNQLKKIWKGAEFIFNKPLTISNIQFSRKALFDHNFLFVGDAAGAISPLSGNGMSMALHGSKILAEAILQQPNAVRKHYSTNWRSAFGSRIAGARMLNAVMLNPSSHHMVLRTLNRLPGLKQRIVRKMQGNDY